MLMSSGIFGQIGVLGLRIQQVFITLPTGLQGANKVFENGGIHFLNNFFHL